MARSRPLRNGYQRVGNFESEIRDIIRRGKTQKSSKSVVDLVLQ